MAAKSIGHNSGEDSQKEKIQELMAQYAKCDEASQELNQERAEIREKVRDLGLDTKAWQYEIQRAKQSLKKREGYDESTDVIRDAFGEMKMEDLFAHVLRRDKEKAEQRETRKTERKQKADEYKPATERAPKNAKVITGKDAAAGEGVDN